MAPAALTFEFAVFVNGVEQPGARFVTSIPSGLGSDTQKMLTGVCHINCDDNDIITLVNVANGIVALGALSSTLGPVNVASMTLRKAGSILIII